MAEIQNPYVAGSPLSGTEMFFGRDDVFEFVKQTLAREHGDHVIVLYGQRRTGKTSVLKQLHRHLDARYLCVFIDLHLLELNGLSGFLWQLARHIRRELERDHTIALPALDRESFLADARDSFRSLFLDQVWAAIGDRQLVLMVDEAVRLQEQISADKLERDVFDYLRHLMQHYPRLRFLFSLGSGLEEMEREYAFLFSVGLYKKISFLERPVAEALITEPVRGCYELEPAAVARVYQTTSGHPYYTQLLCHSLFNRWHEQPTARLAEADVNGVLEEVTERGSAALKNVWDDSTLGERVAMAGLAAAIGNEARVVRTADLPGFWNAHGLDMPPGESGRAFRTLLGRDILVGDDCPTFTVEMQRRWIEKWCRPEWIRQEVADALEAEEAAAGAAGPVARGFRLFEPTPAPPEPEPAPPSSAPPPPAKTGPWASLTGELKLSPVRLLGLVMLVIVLTTLIMTLRSFDPPSASQPTPTPPPLLHGDELHPLIFEAADKARIPRIALLALAEAETGRRSDVEAWPAVYAGWARQRVALTDLGEVVSNPRARAEGDDTLERVVNSSKKAGPAGDRAAVVLKKYLPDPDPTRDQILDALLAYRAENTEASVDHIRSRDLPRYQEALTWAEGYLRATASPSPVVAVTTQTPASMPLPVTGTATPVVAAPTSRFNPAEPTVLQTMDWDDSPAATTWMLRSLGRNVSLGEVTTQMALGRVASPQDGLLDASGARLARMIMTTWNEKAFNKAPVSFDEVAALAGRSPVAIGGRAWRHWTGVRGVNAEGELELANPAGIGSQFGQQRLNREQFEVLGPFSAVWIEP